MQRLQIRLQKLHYDKKHFGGAEPFALGWITELSEGRCRLGVVGMITQSVVQPGIDEAKRTAATWLKQGGHVCGIVCGDWVMWPKEVASESSPVDTQHPGRETILVVDDELDMRELVCELLRRLGYNVLEAHSGDAALQLALLHRGPVDLLLTDLLMPGMNGRELSLTFATLYPKTKVLFLSGYEESDIIRQGVLKPGTSIVQKRSIKDDLARKVREALEGPIPPQP